MSPFYGHAMLHSSQTGAVHPLCIHKKSLRKLKKKSLSSVVRWFTGLRAYSTINTVFISIA